MFKKSVFKKFLLCCVCLLAAVGCAPKAQPSEVVENALEAFRKMDYAEFVSYMAEGAAEQTSSINHAASQKSEISKKALSEIEYSFTGEVENSGTAEVTVHITALYLPDITSPYFSELINMQLNGDIPAEDTEETRAAANELWDRLITEPDAPRMTETVVLELLKSNNEWKIVPNENLISALNGFQDRSPREEE
ncbi:MAG: hypothetical protein LBS62_13410 [Clostridiales bacterium]|nr:hypothetical protein [Clostridiales bacterium]